MHANWLSRWSAWSARQNIYVQALIFGVKWGGGSTLAANVILFVWRSVS